MTTPEANEEMHSPEQKLVISDDLLARLQEVAEHGVSRNIQIYGAVKGSNGVFRFGGDAVQDEVFIASLAKPSLAVMARARIPASLPVPYPDKLIDTSGSGKFDRLEARGRPDHRMPTTDELARDMLQFSGNTAYRVFGVMLGGPEEMRRYYDQKGWHGTQVLEDPSTGRALIGTGDPVDVIEQMEELVLNDNTDPMSRIMRDALERSQTSRFGIRRATRIQPNRLTAWVKSADYPPEKGDPYTYHHEAYVLKGPKGTVSAVIMTKTPGPERRGLLAKGMVGRAGLEIAESAGGWRLAELARRALLQSNRYPHL